MFIELRPAATLADPISAVWVRRLLSVKSQLLPCAIGSNGAKTPLSESAEILRRVLCKMTAKAWFRWTASRENMLQCTTTRAREPLVLLCGRGSAARVETVVGRHGMKAVQATIKSAMATARLAQAGPDDEPKTEPASATEAYPTRRNPNHQISLGC